MVGGSYRAAMATPEAILHLSIPVRDLDAARRFYVDAFGSAVGRERDDWVDVWFFGMQLTLQQRPDEVLPAGEQGVRHFGVVLEDATTYRETVERLQVAGVEWLSEPTVHRGESLSGKVGGKLVDPSGNVIEIKHYPAIDVYRAAAT